MTFTETPGIAALVVSWTTPVIVPRSDCATQRAGVARAPVASMITIRRLITILASRQLFESSREYRRGMSKTRGSRGDRLSVRDRDRELEVLQQLRPRPHDRVAPAE